MSTGFAPVPLTTSMIRARWLSKPVFPARAAVESFKKVTWSPTLNLSFLIHAYSFSRWNFSCAKVMATGDGRDAGAEGERPARQKQSSRWYLFVQ